MEDAEKIYNKLNQIQAIYGWGILIIGLLSIAGLFLIWKFVNKKIELVAEESFERKKTEHSVVFTNTYEKQINTIHNCYSKIQKVKLLMLNREGKDKFNDLPSKVIFQKLIEARKEFSEIYFENKIVFTKSVCNKIDNFLPKLDDYLTELNEGFSYIEYTPEQLEHHKKNKMPVLAGMWIPEHTERVRVPLDEIIEDIESEFRKVHGTG